MPYRQAMYIYIHVHDLYLDLHHAVFVLLQLQLDPLTALHLDGSPLLLQALQDVLTTGTAAVAERLLQTGGEGQALHSVMCGGREGGREGVREGGSKGGREGGREGERE